MFLNENVALPVLYSPVCEPDTTLQAALWSVPFAGVAAPPNSLGVHYIVQEKQWSWCGIKDTC